MTGDGLRFALRGAELAAEVALAALEDPALDARRPAGRGAGPGVRHQVRRQPPAAPAGRDAAARQRDGDQRAGRAGYPAPDDPLRRGRRRVTSTPSGAPVSLQAVALLVVVVLPWLLLETWRSRRHERALRAAGAIEPPDDVYAWMRVVYPGMFVAMTAEGVLARAGLHHAGRGRHRRVPRRQAAEVVGDPLARAASGASTSWCCRARRWWRAGRTG